MRISPLTGVHRDAKALHVEGDRAPHAVGMAAGGKFDAGRFGRSVQVGKRNVLAGAGHGFAAEAAVFARRAAVARGEIENLVA